MNDELDWLRLPETELAYPRTECRNRRIAGKPDWNVSLDWTGMAEANAIERRAVTGGRGKGLENTKQFERNFYYSLQFYNSLNHA